MKFLAAQQFESLIYFKFSKKIPTLKFKTQRKETIQTVT